MRPPGGSADGSVDVQASRGDVSSAELASVVAHDANNVLSPMVLAVELLRAMALPSVTAQADLIGEGCERLSSLLRLLLPAKAAVETRPIDVNTVVRGLAATMQTLAGPAIEVCIRLQEPLAAVLMAPVELERTLLNLIANARDAMPRGGEIVLATTSVHLPFGHASGLEEGDWVRIELRDRGMGMDAATCARAFEPFFTTKAAGGGTGLGLASVKRAVGAASGTVRLASEVGRGTSVEVWLPAASQR